MSWRLVNPMRPCKNLAEYLRWVEFVRKEWRTEDANSKGGIRRLWFRGQRSVKWDLRPRLYRGEYEDADEPEIRLEFEGHGLQLATTNVARTKWEWYFLMQHYGAPTRLQDWTGNSLAALYFAVSDKRLDVKDDHAAVWALDAWRWNDLHIRGLWGPSLPNWQEAKPYLPDLEDACNGAEVRKRWPIAIEPPNIDRRLANQTARFLLFGTTRDLVKAAKQSDSRHRGKKRSRLAQIVIDNRNLESLRFELDDVGINQSTLFPDLQGLGAYLSWEWKDFNKRPREKKK